MNRKRGFLYFSVLLAISALSFTAGFFSRPYLQPQETDFPLLLEAHRLLAKNALFELPEEPALEYGMIRGMLTAYGDPYTRFIEPVETELTTDDLSGQYGGIGASLDHDAEGWIILHPFPDGPAKQAGIQDGDRLLRVDDLELTPATPVDDAVAALRGPEGDPVVVTVARPPAYETFTFEIERQAIPLPSVTWYPAPADPRLGVIQVNLIAASTDDEIETAVAELRAQDVAYFALDLRGNRGGLVDAGVSVARLFLEDGEILKEKYRDQDVETYKVKQPGSLAGLPLVVLVDENTASAAEIIAGALQARGAAVVIGNQTFGKDTIQLAFNLSDESSIYVTAAKWWVPGLEPSIGEGGLVPDIVTSGEQANPDPVIAAAIAFFSEQ
jgi:carboxyl-terminal processing protease